MDRNAQSRKPIRRRLLVNNRLQLSLLASIWLIAAAGMILAVLLSAFWFMFLDEPGNLMSGAGWNGWYGRLALAVLGLLAVMIWGSVMLTHRMAGPLYRIMRRLETMASGDLDQSMRLRRKDEFQELAEQLNLTIHSLRQEREKSRRQALQLASELERLQSVIPGNGHDGSGPDETGSLERARKICSELTGQSAL